MTSDSVLARAAALFLGLPSAPYKRVPMVALPRSGNTVIVA